MTKRKRYDSIPKADIRGDVIETEHFIQERLNSIWSDDIENKYYLKIMDLELSDRRLWITYALLGYSIIKVARLFSVDRKTVSNAINNVKEKLELR